MPPKALVSMRQRRATAKKIKYAEDDLSDGEKEEFAEKRKKARQLEYQTRQETAYPLLDQIVGRRINKHNGLVEYLCKFSGRSYLHLWWLLFEEVELFFPEGYQNVHRIQTFDRKMRREGYQDTEDVDELEPGKITVEKILNHKVDPMDHLDQAIETRRAQVPFQPQFPRVTDAFLIQHADIVHARMSGLVKKLSNEHGGDLFRQPVDTNLVTDYLQIIHNPMDLGTIGSRLARENYYIGPSATSLFASDVRLIFANCMQYNAEKSDIWIVASHLLKTFEKWMNDWILSPSAWLSFLQNTSTKSQLERLDKRYEVWAPWESGCFICHSREDSDKLLLCDRCDGEIHMFCSSPVIAKLPQGEWICSFCRIRKEAEAKWERNPKKNTTEPPMMLVKKIDSERKHNARSPTVKMTRNSDMKATFFLVKWLGLSIRFSTWERPEDIGDDEEIQRYFKFARVPTTKEIESSTCQLPCCAKRNQTLHSQRNCCVKDRFCTLGHDHRGECSREIQRHHMTAAYGTSMYRRYRMTEQIKAQLFALHCLLNNHTPNLHVLKQCGARTYAFACRRELLTPMIPHDEEEDEEYAVEDSTSSSSEDETEGIDMEEMELVGPIGEKANVESDILPSKKKTGVHVSEVVGCMVEHIAFGYACDLEKVQRRVRRNSAFPPVLTGDLEAYTEYGVTLRRSPFGLGMRLGVADNGSTSVLGFQQLSNGMMGPAQAAQVISIGDVLVAVNGNAVAGMGFKDIIQLIARSIDFVTLHFHTKARPALAFPPFCQARLVVCVDDSDTREDAIPSSKSIPYSFQAYRPVLRVGGDCENRIPDAQKTAFVTPNGPMQHLYAAVVDNSIDPHEHFASFLPSKPKSTTVKADKGDFIPYEHSPTYKGGRTLRSYQVEGLNWIISCWKAQRSCILADEMGLGKTIQVAAVLEHFVTEESIRGPFLIVVPLSTIQHWRRELQGWTDLNVCVYHDIGDRQNRGFNSKDMRAMIRMHEWYYPDRGNSSIFRFHALLTTFETILADFEEFESIHWRLLIVDEAHRLKSAGSRVLKQMRVLHCDRKLLLTGTPLQNNMQELWVLINFLEPVKFASWEDFEAKFGRLQSHEQVVTLQKLLAPYVLRRVKEDVEKSIPPKEETIIAVELTTLQKQYYRAIYDKNQSFLYRGIQNGLPRLVNIQLQLRQCCNHPFLIKGVEDRELQDLGPEPTMDRIMDKTIQCSGKFVLVSKLLPKLKREGRKVLIFSQFLKQLDLLERYCEYHGFGYERLDGSTNGAARQASIDRFSRPNAKSFVFLLSTKAGGVGINLIAADTVVIFDSDWNPQNDLQAQSRCHRIGQSKTVQIYRLVTRNTYESEMFERASQKLGLEHAVLGSGSFNDGVQANKPSAQELVDLLKKGAYALLEDDQASKQFAERDIETILRENARVCTMSADHRKQKSLAGIAVDRSSFVADGSTELSVDDPNFWEKVLPGAMSVEMLSIQLEDGSAYATSEAKSKFIGKLGIALDALVLDKTGDHRMGLEREYDLAIQVLHRISTKLSKHFTRHLEIVGTYLSRLEKSRVRTCRTLATPESRRQEDVDVDVKKRKRTMKSSRPKSTQLISETHDLCTLCGDGGLILLCDGPCHRSFHLECIGMTHEPQDEHWLCPDCNAGKHMCLLCKKVGEMGVEFGVLQCSMARCGRFYHRGCLEVDRHVEWVGKKRFRCPSHFCHSCKERKRPRQSTIVSCLHCARAFHADCIPSNDNVLLSGGLMICSKHVKNRQIRNSKSQVCALCDEGDGVFLETPVRVDKTAQPVSVHVECARHAEGVYVNKHGSFCNLARAIKKARQVKCGQCERMGASVRCQKDQSQVFHLQCAKETGSFDDAGFLCKEHEAPLDTQEKAKRRQSLRKRQKRKE
uniref:ChromodomainhelicaseDNAbinding protein putative n=1 Tax=Albugo laibachii Nc14 TaxID=890382 RepID=F0WMW6_9STRA|nr:chromodomainhelicaseDNAbinding protein putative [Albugo laibachii Nc14]|eukprot:CCA22651.1 chromodomainhelicaseDNAbinding protein putative [Albugo laibachii Nc14]